jgi:PAS domain S-box-containing protein
MTSQIRILIVEDEMAVALNIRHRLEEVGYAVVDIVDSGVAVFEAIAATHPDLVLIDIRLPGELDGIQTAERIRRRFKIPVVYLTAYADQTTLERAKRTQPYGYILKPFQTRELYSAIEIALYKHQQEQELKQREQWLSTTLQSIGDAVITTDCRELVTYLNPAAEILTGWRYTEAQGQPLSQIFRIIDERTGEATTSPVTIALLKGDIVSIDNHTLLITKNGGTIPIDDSAAPIKDEDGKVTGAVLVFYDVSERKQIEQTLQRLNQELELRVQERTQELQRRQREFATLANNAPDIIARFDRQLRHLYVNPAIEQMTGIPAEQFIGKTATELGLADELVAVWHNSIQAIFAGQEVCSIEFSFHGTNGLHFYQAELVPETNANQEIESVLSIVRDITQRKQAETQLQTSLEEKNVLLKEIHHRVKNNLQTISSLLKLQATKVQDAGVIEALRESQNRVIAMALVHEKLYQSPSLARINVADYLNNLIEEIINSYGAGTRHIQLQVEVATIELEIDTIIPCGLIINELLSNALTHAFPGDRSGTIHIQFTQSSKNHYLLTVSDNGIGVPETINFQNTTSLGLQLVFLLTQQLQGNVELERENGTTFTIQFDRQPTQKQRPS